ncbi:MAG: haloacid dehalogenase type II [Acetobacteraceae bacterium]|nr:haloacid dehalogenase type II [Acetobacteraceae bacterium]
MELSQFSALSFDCYGTLIDWEAGIYHALQPLIARTGSALSRDKVLAGFARHEARLEAELPTMPYSKLLSVLHDFLAREWGVEPDQAESRRFAASIGDWEPFPDTVPALRYLKRHFHLVILSNVDRESFRATNARLGVSFDEVCTAEDIGSYKPDPRNFAYLIAQVEAMGTPRDRLLHVAQSLYHDHVPAQAAGLASAWIDRQHGATVPPTTEARYDFRFTSLEELADTHRKELHGTAARL